jgi:hypothetical protein
LGRDFHPLAGEHARRTKRRREPSGPRLPSFNYLTYFLPPEQESQQSAEAQHVTFAAFTAPAKLSATTAINTIARMFFMDFSPLKNRIVFFVD